MAGGQVGSPGSPRRCSASLLGAHVLVLVNTTGCWALHWVLSTPLGCWAPPPDTQHPTMGSASPAAALDPCWVVVSLVGCWASPLCHQEGSVALAFKQTHPGPDSAPKLYQVKGKRKIWGSQWDPTWASFNAGDLPPGPGTAGWSCPHCPTPCSCCCHPWPPDPSHQVRVHHVLCAPLSPGVSISLFSLGHPSLHRTGCLSSSWGVCLSFQWPLGQFTIHRGVCLG